jgi:zinc transport system ATP-binding protein
VTLVGPNGAGKTTLLRILLGLQRPSAGSAWRRPGLRIGYLPQRLAIDETLPLTVRRLLALAGPAGKERIDAALAEVGAKPLASMPVQALSGGELQRVLLARALLREPDLLVLDEPVQGVDVTGQGELYALIRHIRDRRGCGVLLVSHDLHLVMAASDEVVCLNRHVCCSGHPETVTRHPAYRALFGDAIAVYAHHHDHVHDPVAETMGEGRPRPETASLLDGTDG